MAEFAKLNNELKISDNSCPETKGRTGEANSWLNKINDNIFFYLLISVNSKIK